MSFVVGTGRANLDLLFSGLDRLPGEGEEIYSKDFDIQMGGGAPATMINVSSLGVPAKIITMLGTDFFSNMVETTLQKHGVEYINLYQGDKKPVSITCAMITNKDRTFMSYVDDVEVTDEMLQLVIDSCKGAKIIQMQVGYIDVYKRIKQLYPETLFLFDTGWEDDLSIEKYQEYITLADYYTPSKCEALKITGMETVEDALEVLKGYFKYPLIKLDKDGSMIECEGEIVVIPPMEDVVQVDSTGAGDAFTSGLLFGIYHDYSFLDSVIFGNVCGGFCIQKVGCLANFPTEKELIECGLEIKKKISCFCALK